MAVSALNHDESPETATTGGIATSAGTLGAVALAAKSPVRERFTLQCIVSEGSPVRLPSMVVASVKANTPDTGLKVYAVPPASADIVRFES